ncbi:MAG TPA: MFS transporter [bacterium]|nr:MFS transporter [bacterium]
MHPRVRAALLVAAAASFLNPYMVSALTVALPAVGREFHADAATLSWITTAYLLASVVCFVPFGRLADLYGRRRLFTIGVVLFVLASVACALAPSTAVLLACRVFQGVSSAMIFSNGVAMLTAVAPPALRGRLLGVTVACVYIGLSLGPVIGGVLTQVFGWRSVFLGTVPLGFATFVLAVWFLPGDADGLRGTADTGSTARAGGIDPLSVALYAAMFAGFAIGLSTVPAPASPWLIAAGLAAGAWFASRSLRVRTPVLDVRLFQTNRVFTLSSLAALLNYAAGSPSAFLVSLSLQYVRGMTPAHAGVVLIAQPATQAVVSPAAGWLSERIEPRVVASVGMAMTAAGLAALAAAPPSAPVSYVAAALVVMGAGFGLFSSPNTNAIMSSVPPSMYGVAAGVTSTVRIAGQLLSFAAITMIFNAFLGAAPVTAANLFHFRAAARLGFAVFAAACATGVLASLARGNVHAGPLAPAPARPSESSAPLHGALRGEPTDA